MRNVRCPWLWQECIQRTVDSFEYLQQSCLSYVSYPTYRTQSEKRLHREKSLRSGPPVLSFLHHHVMGLFSSSEPKSSTSRPDPVLPSALDLPLFNKLRGASTASSPICVPAESGGGLMLCLILRRQTSCSCISITAAVRDSQDIRLES